MGSVERLEHALESIHEAYSELLQSPPGDGDFFSWARLGIMSSDLVNVADCILHLAESSVSRAPDEQEENDAG